MNAAQDSALEKAWSQTASRLRGFIRARVRDHADAEDILQDVFLKAHRHARDLDRIENLGGWLHTTARNAIVDFYRRRKTALELPEELPAENLESPLEPAEALREAFRGMVFALPQPYREALVLTEFEGLSQKALAERLGISLSGAKSRVQRGREKLREAVLDCCQLEFDRRGNVIECEPRHERCRCEQAPELAAR